VTFLGMEEWRRGVELYNAGVLDQFDVAPLPAPVGMREWYRHASEAVILPAPLVLYCGFRATRPPLDDARVRRAFAMATDPQDLLRRTGFWVPATGGFLPSNTPAHSPGLNLAYDPDRARQLLAEAGYPHGRGLRPLEVLMPADPIPYDVYPELQQEQWVEGLGAELMWRTLPWPQYVERLAKDPPDLFAGFWVAHYHDPDSFLRVGFPWMATGWHSEAYSHLVGEAGRLTDPKRRMALYRQADKILMEEAAVVPVEYGAFFFLIRPWVKRFPTALPFRGWMLQDVVVERH
jgi:oligopeptide transport system substrate-binding protein